MNLHVFKSFSTRIVYLCETTTSYNHPFDAPHVVRLVFSNSFFGYENRDIMYHYIELKLKEEEKKTMLIDAAEKNKFDRIHIVVACQHNKK